MACVGRQRVCNVVPPNHFGPIPGVEVGTLWKFRVQVGICFFIKCLKILFAEGRAYKTFYPSIRFFFFSFIKYLFRDVNFLVEMSILWNQGLLTKETYKHVSS